MEGAPRPVVLVVDDEPDNLEFLRQALHQEYEVLSASHAEEAIAILRRAKVDAVLANQRMPGMSGLELLQAASRYAPQAGRMLMSAVPEAEVLAEAINRASVQQFISKPYSPAEIRSKVRGLIPTVPPPQPRIVVVSPDHERRSQLSALLVATGYEVREHADLEGIKELLAERGTGALIADLALGSEALGSLLTQIRGLAHRVPLLVSADRSKAEEALALVRLGAHDVVLHPFREEEVTLRASHAVEQWRMFGQIAQLRSQVQDRFAFHGLVGASPKMREVYDLIERAADTDSTVLIRGETGTGKEVVARILHQLSRRREGPFVAVNCAAIPESLVESELFGHQKGAFTGAVARHLGRFEMASGGTLFLDEVGDMPPAGQVKLLRALQERVIERVGGEAPIKVDVRLIAATAADLRKGVEAGRFRQDLYYRLNVLQVWLPPLRERKEDLPMLVSHFLRTFEKQMGKERISLSSGALAELEAHRWPGNVRELANVIERVVALARSNSEVGPEHLGLSMLRTPSPGGTVAASQMSGSGKLKIRQAVEHLERTMIVSALEQHGWNQTRAAKQLGITRQGLSQKMAKYGIKEQQGPRG